MIRTRCASLRLFTIPLSAPSRSARLKISRPFVNPLDLRLPSPQRPLTLRSVLARRSMTPVRSFSNRPRRVFQVAGVPDPRHMPQPLQEISKVNQERKYVRYFLVGAGVQLVFTSIGAHMLYTSWEYKDTTTFIRDFSQEAVVALCAGVVCLGLACFALVRYNARRRITSMTLLPGGKRLRMTTFTMFGTVSKPFEIDVADIVRGKWIASTNEKIEPGFWVKGKRMGYNLDPEARVDNLPLLKAVIKHPKNLDIDV